ncbi:MULTISPECIES: FkbM family methyltransferase [Brevibacillus]|jgi:FkbM family methyltransferase|uniref:Methyltransf-21 domain-containing protein n=1 Tax=Brevibacillus aydinogluensis TaxID=927786 RepID=A0AA48M8Z6_9BACL|nr:MULTISPECIES: FkbM family methyltransferase [Brevibacillus]MBR8660838.1 FkbM family methyltransferase [Brevibacillus sp. NL20B1]CAJ1003482.1 Methyltransf-21 domain-containing protein [Brevibacillus aydinogluensis]
MDNRQFLKHAVRTALDTRNFDWVFRQFPNRSQLIAHKRIALVLDVGANTGQFASKLRQQGYRGRIVSFEPLSKEFAQLQQLASSDPHWDCKQVALGSTEGQAIINIAGNSYSSSLLPMLDRHVIGAPDSRYVGRETIVITRLDTLLPSLIHAHERVYLKLDVQGYELEVLKGAQRTLPHVDILEMELSLVPLYQHQLLYPAMIDYVDRLGFDLLYLERDFADYTTGEVLQVNGIFVRR